MMNTTSLQVWWTPNQQFSKEMQFHTFSWENWIWPSNFKSTALGELTLVLTQMRHLKLELLYVRVAQRDRFGFWKLGTISLLPWEDSGISSKELPVGYHECGFLLCLGVGAGLPHLLWLHLETELEFPESGTGLKSLLCRKLPNVEKTV